MHNTPACYDNTECCTTRRSVVQQDVLTHVLCNTCVMAEYNTCVVQHARVVQHVFAYCTTRECDVTVYSNSLLSPFTVVPTLAAVHTVGHTAPGVLSRTHSWRLCTRRRRPYAKASVPMSSLLLLDALEIGLALLWVTPERGSPTSLLALANCT